MGKPSKTILRVSLICILLLTGLVAAVIASPSIKTTLPEIFKAEEKPVIVPLLLPPVEPQYEAGDPLTIAKNSQHELAYLSEAHSGANTTLVNISKTEPEPDWANSDTAIGWVELSLVKYEGSGATTVVCLSKPTMAAAKAGGIYGFRTVTLSDGEQGFIKDLENGPYPRALVVIKGDRVVTIATTANEDTLLKMGTNIQLAP